MMDVNIKSSDSLDLLADKLITAMLQKDSNVFTPFYVVTQTDGMMSWLKMRIAEKTGIAANLLFLKPNELIHLIYSHTGGKYEQNLSNADIQWLIFKALANPTIAQTYPALADYYAPKGTVDHVKRIALSQQLSDLYDQYQVYRMPMLKGWEEGKLSTAAYEERWQRDIWALVRKDAGERFPDKSRIRDSIIQNLRDTNNAQQLHEKIPEINFFGTSLITSFHYDILQAVAQYLPVTFYLPNPAPHLYWYEDKSKKALFYQRRKGGETDEDLTNSNPLLLNWGKLIQNTFQLFFANDEALNRYEDLPSALQPTTLLSSVQRLIHENASAEGTKFDERLLNDGTIAIKSCYSVAREVESLYNYLVKILDENPGQYATRDIVVHVTDINKYSSYIRAVFGNAPYQMKYTIADESYTASDTVSQALYEILSLDEKSFTAENVVQLLNFSSVRRHFSITDVALIRRVVAEANIRHGIDGNTANDSVYVSWKYGLRRIIYGICINSDEEYEPGHEGFFPLQSIEGSDAGEVIHFVYMVRKLLQLLEERKQTRTVSGWIEYIYEILRHLIFDEEERDNTEYQQLTEHISGLAVDEGLFDEEIPFDVFLRQFLPGLTEMTQTYKFARGGITFCSLIPMRSIPFKIVAMLGLNFDKFPRKPVVSGFDLMHKFPKAGDRNIKVNDKHLFLETVMSAGDYLYLSYTGQRAKDNAKLPPSILVDELVSFIESSSSNPEKVRDIIITEEPLHSFSIKYGNEPGYFNYLLSAKKPLEFGIEAQEKNDSTAAIDLNELYKFLCAPVSWYFKNEIGIYFDDETITLPDTEILELNHLEKHLLKTRLLMLQEESLDIFADQQKKLGNLPLKSAADYEVQNANKEIDGIKKAFDDERAGQESSMLSLHVEMAGRACISATIDFAFDKKILVPCFSKDAGKYYLKAWLYSLLVAAAGMDTEVVFIGERRSRASLLPQSEAKDKLRELLDLMDAGRSNWTPFHIKWHSLLGSSMPKDAAKLMEAITKCHTDKQYTELALQHGMPDDFFDQYVQFAEALRNPIKQTFNL